MTVHIIGQVSHGNDYEMPFKMWQKRIADDAPLEEASVDGLARTNVDTTCILVDIQNSN